MLIANLCTLLAKGCADETTARMADWRQPRRLPEVHRASPTNLSLTVRKLRFRGFTKSYPPVNACLSPIYARFSPKDAQMKRPLAWQTGVSQDAMRAVVS